MSAFFRHSAAQTLYLDGAQRIDAATLAGHIHALAQRLPEATQVLNLCDDRLNFLCAFGAALTRGQTTLLPANRTRHHLASLLETYPATTVLVDDAASAGNHAHVLVDHRAWPAVPGTLPVVIAPERDAAVLFTSGSSGVPTAQRKTWRMLSQGAQLLAQTMGAVGTLVSSVPQQHMFGLESSVMLPLQGALTLAAGCPLLPQDLLAQLSELPEPAWWMTTPLHLRACLDSGLRFPALAGIVCATQTLDPALAQAAEACFQTRLLEIYGCTEVGMVGLRRTAQTRDWQLCADLELTPGTQPMRVTGVRCGAAQVLHDRIELLPNRQFRLHGRAADLIKIGGKRMHLDALNRALLSIPGVHDGVFFQPAADARLLAFAVAPTLDRAQILAALRERIDAVFLPRPLHLLDALPRNAVGKLPQQALLELAARDAVAS